MLKPPLLPEARQGEPSQAQHRHMDPWGPLVCSPRPQFLPQSPCRDWGEAKPPRRAGKKEGTSAVLPSLLTPLCTRSCNLSRISGSLCAHIPRPKTSLGLLPAINPPPERAGRRLPTSSMGTDTALGRLGAGARPPGSLPGCLEASWCCSPRVSKPTSGSPSSLSVGEASGERAHRPLPFPAASPRRATRASPPHRHPGGLGMQPFASLISSLKELRALQCSERRGKGRKQNRHPQERDKAGRANKRGRERGEGEAG